MIFTYFKSIISISQVHTKIINLLELQNTSKLCFIIKLRAKILYVQNLLGLNLNFLAWCFCLFVLPSTSPFLLFRCVCPMKLSFLITHQYHSLNCHLPLISSNFDEKSKSWQQKHQSPVIATAASIFHSIIDVIYHVNYLY